MDYYEELALPPTASADEIRRAYKRLAIQFHPDRCLTDSQKRWAGARMRRLNEIFETLGNAEERQRYDEAMQEDAIRHVAQSQHQQMFEFRQNRRKKIWISAFGLGSIFLVIGGLFFSVFDRADRVFSRLGTPVGAVGGSEAPKSDQPAAANDKAPAPAAPPTGTAPVGRAEAPPQLAKSVDPTAETAMYRQRELTNSSPPARSATPVEPPPANSSPAVVEGGAVAPSTTVVAQASAVPSSSVAGTWIFSPARSPETKLPYVAEYVEVSIRLQRQRAIGRFQGRFNVRSSTLPPRVVFQFEGAEQDLATGILWRAENGAEGVVKMHLLSDKELELGWYTTRFAATPVLTSGTAVLSREPSEN